MSAVMADGCTWVTRRQLKGRLRSRGVLRKEPWKRGKRIFPALRGLRENDLKNAWSGAIHYTLDDYPFVERRQGSRVITFAAPSDHGNALAARVGQLVGDLVAGSLPGPRSDEQSRRRRRDLQQLRLFEGFPKGVRLRPGMRYQEAASPASAETAADEP